MPFNPNALPAMIALLFLGIPSQALPVRLRVVSLCTSQGVRMMTIPDDGTPGPGRSKDCAAACHMAGERRKGNRETA